MPAFSSARASQHGAWPRSQTLALTHCTPRRREPRRTLTRDVLQASPVRRDWIDGLPVGQDIPHARAPRERLIGTRDGRVVLDQLAER